MFLAIFPLLAFSILKFVLIHQKNYLKTVDRGNTYLCQKLWSRKLITLSKEVSLLNKVIVSAKYTEYLKYIPIPFTIKAGMSAQTIRQLAQATQNAAYIKYISQLSTYKYCKKKNFIINSLSPYTYKAGFQRWPDGTTKLKRRRWKTFIKGKFIGLSTHYKLKGRFSSIKIIKRREVPVKWSLNFFSP